MNAPVSVKSAECIQPGRFEPVRHFYPKVLNSQIHPMVRFFMGMSNERIVERIRHLNPQVNADALAQRLSHVPRHLRWAGCDLMHVTNEVGHRQMIVIETNSCPSGQKSMPLYEEFQEDGGYGILVEHAFKSLLDRKRSLPEGGLAVIYDKNEMEASGYAAAIASAMEEPVWLARWDDHDPDPPTRFKDRVLEVRDASGVWRPIRAAMRYVTQRPWNRLAIHTKTQILNPVVVCLAGGRNKMIAAKAYEFFNAKQEFEGSGLTVNTPETYRDVRLNEVPLWVNSLGGRAVVKVPYSNAGQGVYTITNEAELEAFMKEEHRYGRFIVQSLIGNYEWSSRSEGRGRLYHVGTIPDKRLRSYVADLRMMVVAGPAGFRPVAIYARRAREPLATKLNEEESSWSILGTNLSLKNPDGSWGSDTERLMLMDRKDFNRLGVSLDGLIEAYVQTVLSVTAIDELAMSLFTKKGRFRKKLFASLNEDQALLDEILVDAP